MKQDKSNPFVKNFLLAFFISTAFIFNFCTSSVSYAQDVDLNLPPPSKIKAISKPFNPATIRAITVNPNDPFLFDFIIDKGDTNLDPEAFEAESQKLVKYFLAALTIPEADLWVNLSPYEQDAMVSPVLGVTELGKDLLIKDYYLKQVTAQLTNPNTPTGKKFWDLAYKKAQELYGNTNVPINTFSKVWIVPDQAVVLEKDGSAFVADSHLKVFLDQDYLAVKENLNNKEIGTDKLGSDKTKDINNFSAQIIKEVVLPEIEKEVNVGENFAAVRQIYSAAILATWYKSRLKESLLGKLYADQNKVAGVNAEDMDSGDKIFEKYTAALKTGAYNIIKQDFDLSAQKIVQRKYFSGGANFRDIGNKIHYMPSTGNINEYPVSPAQIVAISEQVAKFQTASSGGGAVREGKASSSFEVLHVRLAGVASASVMQVDERLGGDKRFNSGITTGTIENLNRIAHALAVPASSGGTQNSSIAPTVATPAVMHTLAGMSPAEVRDYADLHGLDPKPITAVHREIQRRLENVPPAKRPVVIQNFVPSSTAHFSPLIMSSLARQENPLATVQEVALLSDKQFEERVTAVAPKVPSAVIDSLRTARREVRSLKPEQTVFAVAANPGVDLSIFSAPEVKSTFPITSESVVSETARQSLAFSVATAVPSADLGFEMTRANFSPSDINRAKDEQIALRSAATNIDRASVQTPVLSRLAAEKPEVMFAAAGIDSAPTAMALLEIANSDSNLEEKLRDNGFSESTIIKVGLAKPALVEIQKTNPNNPVAFMQAVNNTPNLVKFKEVLKNPVLAQALISQSATVSITKTDSFNDQVAAAQMIVNFDTSNMTSSNTLSSMMQSADIGNDEVARILQELPSVRKSLSENPKLPIVQAISRTTLARVISEKPAFVKAVLANSRTARASSTIQQDNILTNESRTVALLATSTPQEVVALFSNHPNPKVNELSPEDRTAIGTAVQKIAVTKPSAFRTQTTLYDTLIRQGGLDPKLAILVANVPEVDRLAQIFDRKVNTLNALSNDKVTVDVLSSAFGQAGVTNSQNLAENFAAIRSSQLQSPEARTIPITAQLARVNPALAEAVNKVAGNEGFQRAIAPYVPTDVDNTSPALQGEARQEIVASRIYTAVNASTPDQKRKLYAALGRDTMNPITPEVVKVWVSKAQGINLATAKPAQIAKQAPEFGALLKMPKVKEAFSDHQASSASATVATKRQAIFGTPNLDQGQLAEAVARKMDHLSGVEREQLLADIAAINAYAQANPAFLTRVQGLPVDQFKEEVAREDGLKVSSVFAQEYNASLERDVGGIDLSADKMGLQIKRDGKGVVLPIADQDLQNIKIDGLAPVILDVQPATPASVPFLMNLANTAQSK